MHTPGPERPLQSPSFSHGPQVLAAEQSGVVFAQSASVTQATQAPLVAQAGFARSWPAQAPAPAGAWAHPTHAPAPEQNGFAALLQLTSVAHSTQVRLVGLQAGVAPLQSLFDRQPTHARVAVSQTGVAGVGAQSALASQPL